LFLNFFESFNPNWLSSFCLRSIRVSGKKNMSGIIFSLRDYQRECLESILERYRAGVRRQLTSLPTGSGKTVIFAEFPRYFSMKKQINVLRRRKIEVPAGLTKGQASHLIGMLS
jgi:hypothetical protein